MTDLERLVEQWWTTLDGAQRADALAAPPDDPPGWAVAAVVARIVEHCGPDHPDSAGLTARAATLVEQLLESERATG